jgi:hypothetical protein
VAVVSGWVEREREIAPPAPDVVVYPGALPVATMGVFGTHTEEEWHDMEAWGYLKEEDPALRVTAAERRWSERHALFIPGEARGLNTWDTNLNACCRRHQAVADVLVLEVETSTSGDAVSHPRRDEARQAWVRVSLYPGFEGPTRVRGVVTWAPGVSSERVGFSVRMGLPEPAAGVTLARPGPAALKIPGASMRYDEPYTALYAVRVPQGHPVGDPIGAVRVTGVDARGWPFARESTLDDELEQPSAVQRAAILLGGRVRDRDPMVWAARARIVLAGWPKDLVDRVAGPDSPPPPEEPTSERFEPVRWTREDFESWNLSRFELWCRDY